MSDSSGGPFKPEDFEFEHETSGSDPSSGNAPKTRIKWSFATEDIIAVFAGVIAIIVVLGMVFRSLPVNAYTVGLASFGAAGAVIAKIIQARRPGGTSS